MWEHTWSGINLFFHFDNLIVFYHHCWCDNNAMTEFVVFNLQYTVSHDSHQFSSQEFRCTMCIANPCKSWLSLIVSWLSLSNKDPHIFFNVVVFLFVESLKVHLSVLKYSLFNSLIESWDEVNALNSLKRVKACFHWLSDLYDELVDRFWVEMWLKKCLCSWDEEEKYVQYIMLNKVAETVDEWRWDSLLCSRRSQKRGKKHFWESTESAFLNALPDWSCDQTLWTLQSSLGQKTASAFMNVRETGHSQAFLTSLSLEQIFAYELSDHNHSIIYIMKSQYQEARSFRITLRIT